MKKVFVLILTLITVIGISTAVFATSVKVLQQQIKDNENEIKDKEEQVTQIKSEQKSLLAQITELGTQINQLETQIKRLNAQISTCDAEIKSTEEELAAKEAEMEEQYNLLKTRVAVMYESGNISILDVLLGSDSITDFLSKYYMMSEIMEFDQNLLDKMTIQKEQIATLKVQLEEKKATLQANKDEVKTKTTTLSASKQTLNSKNAELESDKKELEKSIDAILDESARLTTEIIKLQGTANYAGGTMAWPLPGFSTITSPYGMRLHPTLKVYKLHTGVDIAGRNAAGVGCYGKPIVAANSGKVITAKYNTAYGYMIMIDHGGKIVTLYGHASKLLVSAGDIVTKGQTIAYAGTTGYSTGAHLHFEVRVNGSTTNPLPYIQ